MPKILVERHAATAVVSIHRPEVRNAFDLDAMAELRDAAEALAADRAVRCVVFTGAGVDAFCSGGDLKAFQALRSWQHAYDMSCLMQRALARLESLPVPVVGVLNGYALGGGCEAFLATDLRIAEDHAFMGFKQLQLGVSLGWGGAARLARDIGGRRAFNLVAKGERLAPREAQDLGIVDEVVGQGAGLPRALHLGLQFASLAPLAVAALKRMTRQDDDARIHQEASVFAATWASRDHHEAVDAFFEKRAPSWEGR